ncbi:MAG: hypothetical protein K6G67_05290 [Lachnospiraceae bacterium]|nr:hypothetical protein [Lachnospiraceae bacterium]
MDGFRERLSGRYDRSGTRGSGYDRAPSDDRYEGDRYERVSRRGASEGISQEALNEAVTEAVSRSNREQLDVIADFFDEAKADRMESERAIIDALSHEMNEVTAKMGQRTPAPAQAEPVAPAAPIAVVDEQNAETLSRIERIVGQNAEALNENSEVLTRNVDSLRSNSEALNEIRSSIGQLVTSSEEIKSLSRAPQPMQDLTVDFTDEKNEIVGAIGDNRAILNMIRQDVLNGFARNNEDEESQEEKVVPLSSEDAGRYYKELEEHVHKECVKCYRNVQSALTEQTSEANSGIEKSVSGMRIMVLLSLIFSFVAAAVGIASFLMSMNLF